MMRIDDSTVMMFDSQHNFICCVFFANVIVYNDDKESVGEGVVFFDLDRVPCRAQASKVAGVTGADILLFVVSNDRILEYRGELRWYAAKGQCLGCSMVMGVDERQVTFHTESKNTIESMILLLGGRGA